MEASLSHAIQEVELHGIYLYSYLGINCDAEMEKLLEIYIKTFWPEYFNKFFS